jgi:hypothetical protein
VRSTCIPFKSARAFAVAVGAWLAALIIIGLFRGAWPASPGQEIKGRLDELLARITLQEKIGVRVITAIGDDLTDTSDPMKKAMRRLPAAELEKARSCRQASRRP